jgi:hypothetical protein
LSTRVSTSPCLDEGADAQEKPRGIANNDNLWKANDCKRCHSFSFFIDPFWAKPYGAPLVKAFPPFLQF